MDLVSEGGVVFLAEPKVVVDRKMPVFFNPLMVVNRDFSLLVLLASGKSDLVVADPLAGSGVRSLRLLKELPKEVVRQVFVNDLKLDFKRLFSEALSLNELSSERVVVESVDASLFLSSCSCDYVDVDPFGSPNPFLDSAVRSLRRNGILAVTATDTSALCGSYPRACFRKYWAHPLKSELMHEFGLRILVRKVQLIGAQHGKALVPFVSYSLDHYMKVFFRCVSGKKVVDEVLDQHDVYSTGNGVFGPLWFGELNNLEFLEGMVARSGDLPLSSKTLKLLHALKDEARVQVPFFFDMHTVSSKLKSSSIPRIDAVMAALESRGFLASRTHVLDTAIKTDASFDVFVECFRESLKN